MRLNRRTVLAGLAAPFVANRAMAGGEFVRLASPFEESSPVNQILYDATERIRRETDWAVDIEILPRGSFGKSSDYTALLQKGALDFALLPDAMLGRLQPRLAALNYGPFFGDFETWQNFQNSNAKPMIRRLMSAASVDLIGAGWWSAQHICLRKPIRQLSDLKGITVRNNAPNSPLTAALRQVGVKTLVLAHGDLLPALSLGNIDGAVLSVAYKENTALYSMLRAVVVPPIGGSTYWLSASRQTMRRISRNYGKGLESIVRENLTNALQEADQTQARVNAKAIDAVKGQGVNFVRLTDRDSSRLNELMIASAKKRGLPEDLVKALQDIA